MPKRCKIYIIMGCDYYIYVYLEIHHTNGISYYPLPTIRGYYCDLECVIAMMMKMIIIIIQSNINYCIQI